VTLTQALFLSAPLQKDVSGLKASCRAKSYEFVVNDKWFGSEDGMQFPQMVQDSSTT
jgi:hypothetical protein